MIQSKEIGTLNQLTATEGYLHKIGTDIYCTSAVLLPGETADMYEEVSAKPSYTKGEYDAKVAELVRERYSASEEFAIQRKAINVAFSPSVTATDPAMVEYAAYNTYVDECKQKAKIILSENDKTDIA